jgi:hypothetical protein
MVLRQAQSTDYFVMTRACLEAAIRTEDDLAELFNSAPTRAPAKPVPEHVALA